MSERQVDIDWIVAEVMRRLGRRAGTAGGASAAAPLGGAPKRTEPPVGEVRLETRLVTLSTLEGKWRQMQRLVVPRGAVVTPAVRDELRRRGVSLLQAETEKENPTGLAVLVCCQEDEALRMAEALTADGRLPVEREPRLTHAVEAVARRAATQGGAWILLTEQPLAAVCVANRRPAIRAAAGINGRDAAEAVQQLGANLLVVDPRQVTAVDWQQIVERFARPLPRREPPLLRSGGV